MKQHYDITGMTCSACAAHVEKAARSVPGVTEAQVNLLANKMTCEQADDKLTAQVIAAVQKAGYGASVPGAASAAPGFSPTARRFRPLRVWFRYQPAPIASTMPR